MSIKTINFPLTNNRHRHKPPLSHLPLNNQRHHPAAPIQNPHSTTQTTSHSNEPFFSSLLPVIGSTIKPRPYHLNDFANNHLFIAKRKIAQVFHEQPKRDVQSTNDLLYLFDPQDPKRKNRHANKPNRQGILSSKTSTADQDVHLSVLNLHVSPPYSSTQTRNRTSPGLIRPFDLWSGVKYLSPR